MELTTIFSQLTVTLTLSGLWRVMVTSTATFPDTVCPANSNDGVSAPARSVVTDVMLAARKAARQMVDRSASAGTLPSLELSFIPRSFPVDKQTTHMHKSTSTERFWIMLFVWRERERETSNTSDNLVESPPRAIHHQLDVPELTLATNIPSYLDVWLKNFANARTHTHKPCLRSNSASAITTPWISSPTHGVIFTGKAPVRVLTTRKKMQMTSTEFHVKTSNSKAR